MAISTATTFMMRVHAAKTLDCRPSAGVGVSEVETILMEGGGGGVVVAVVASTHKTQRLRISAHWS